MDYARSRRNRRRGFSLAEIVVVLAIIIIGSTFALNAYSSHARTQGVRSSAQEVSRALLYAKQYAITRRTRTIIRFDLPRQLYWIDEADSSGAVTAAKIVQAKALETGTIIQDVQVGSVLSSTGVVSAEFDSTGNNPLVEITIRREIDDASDPRNYYTIQLFPASDDPRILPNERR